MLIKLREIKSKIDRRTNAKDRSNNIVSVKDVVRVIEGPCKVRYSIIFLLSEFLVPFSVYEYVMLSA